MNIWLAIVPFLAMAVMSVVAQQLGGGRETTGYCLAASSLLSAGFALWLASKAGRPTRHVERQTGREFVIRETHSLLGIPPLAWAGLNLALAAVFVYLGNR
ncbi:MAG: hypothetical protein JST65_05150 [Acidobacteria bacterium]|nr:hypothetical protein [Acidobacteriota bacterium]